MATRHNQTTVASVSATVIEGTQYPGYILLNNSSVVVYLGDGSTSSSVGYPINPGDTFSPSELSHRQLTGADSDRLYGRAASGTADVRVLVPGKVKP